MKRKAQIQICYNTRGRQRWWYRLVAANGEIVIVSEKFLTKSNALRAAKRFIGIVMTVPAIDLVEMV